MNLKSESAVAWDFICGFFLGVVNGLEAIQPNLYQVALCFNTHLVPIPFGLRVLSQFILWDFRKHLSSSGLVIEKTPD